MISHISTAFDASALRAFEEDRRLRLLVAVRYACLASILALAAFSLFDSFWHVGELHNLLYARTLTLASLMMVLVVSFTPLGVRFIDQLAVVACLFFSGGTVLVAELAGGGLSIYRDPIYIIFIGFTLLIPWRPSAAAFCFATGIAFYDVLYFFTGGMGYLGTWLVSNIMLAVGAVIATFSVSVINRLQRVEFGYRRRLQNLDEKLFAVDSVEQIFANLGRELRAPLTLFMTPLETMLQEPKLSDSQRQALDLCRRNAIRLLRMVDDRLAMAQLHPPVVRVDLDLVASVKQLLAELQPLATRRRITMSMQDVPSSLPVRTDDAVLEQGVLAMLAYAIDSAKGGSIRVAVTRRNNGAEVTVQDDGVGLSVQELANLFSHPATLVPDAPTPRRAALSLAAARQRVERLGGSLQVESVIGHGTTLRLWVPRN